MVKPRKFYRVLTDFSISPPGLVLENEKLLTPSGRTPFVSVWERGFPPYLEVPRFRHDPRQGRMPKDFELCSSFWLISDLAKTVFQAIDPEAFQFITCDVYLDDGRIGPKYWICDVVRIVDALDESNSHIYINLNERRKIIIPLGPTKLCFYENIVGAAHIFRPEYFTTFLICDEVFRKACTSQNLSGIVFGKPLHIGE